MKVKNQVSLIGRITKDPELKTSPSGKSRTTFSIAVDKPVRPTDGSPTAHFFNVTCFDQKAEFACNYLTKGRLIAVCGSLSQRKWETDGVTKEIVEVIAEDIQNLDRPTDDRPSQTVDEEDPFKDE